MAQLNDWDGPTKIRNNGCRYTKDLAWKRLYIEIYDSEFFGGVTGTGQDFELALDCGFWKKYPIDAKHDSNGDICPHISEGLVLYLEFHRVGCGVPLTEKIESIEDLAAYLESCVYK